MTNKPKTDWEEWGVKNGTTWFPLRQVSEIFFNDEVLTLEDVQSGGDNYLKEREK